VCILTNEQNPPAEGNLCDERKELINVSLLKTSQLMGYTDEGSRMASSYSVSVRILHTIDQEMATVQELPSRSTPLTLTLV
jgi:hypothetical protein